MDIETTWGTISIELAGDGVAGCTLPMLTEEPGVPFRIKNPPDDPVSTFVAAVFSGRPSVRPPLAELAGTEFQQRVLRSIADIPLGQTRTYGELAAAIGSPKAVRAVGSACGRNPVPLFIPCHRVTAANGRLGGFSCGLPWKRLLLEAEAIMHP